MLMLGYFLRFFCLSSCPGLFLGGLRRGGWDFWGFRYLGLNVLVE